MKASTIFIFILGLVTSIGSKTLHAQNQIDLCTQWRDFTVATGSTSLVLDGKDIWIGTQGGLIKFDTTTNQHQLFLKTNSGLPVNWITSLLKDRSGAIWIGTWGGGVSRYSNGSWTTFNTHNQALPDSIILSLCLDSLGNVWVGTSSGLAKYDGTKLSLIPLPNLPAAYKAIYALATDPSGSLWVGVQAGNDFGALDKFDGSKWTAFTPQNSVIPSQYIYSLACKKDGTVWIGLEYGIIASFDGSTFTIFNAQPSTGGGYSPITAIAVGDDGSIWTGNYVGTGRFNNNKWQTFSTSGTNAIVIANGTAWIGQNGGLTKIHGTTLDTYNDFSNCTLTANEMEAAVTTDQHGNTWAATFAGSQQESNTIAVYDGKSWTTIVPPINPTNMSRPISLGADSLGNVWIGMMDIGLVRYDGTNWDVFNETNSVLHSNRPKCITYDKKSNTLWAGFYLNGGVIGGSAGCAAFDGTTWKSFKGVEMGFPGYAEINGIAVDALGNVWAGAAFQGIARFDGSKWQLFTTTNSGLPDDFVNGVACQKSGAVWIATNNGLAKFENSTWTVYNSSNSPLPDDAMTAVSVDTLDRVWIGTFGHGAALYDHGKWIIDGQENSGISNYHIQTIVTDTHNQTWFAMEYAGLAEYSPIGFQTIQPLFVSDTISGCDTAAISKVLLFGNACQNRNIISQQIAGVDAAYYRVIHQASNPITQDSIIVTFSPDAEREFHANLVLILEDGSEFSIPLMGFGKVATTLTLSSSGQFNDTIGGSIDVPVIISHSNILSSAQITLHYDTTMLVYQGSTLHSGGYADVSGENWLGRSRLNFASSDLRLNDTIAYAHFLIFPQADPCTDVIFDSLITSDDLKNCIILSNNSMIVHVCSTIGCGTRTLTNFLRYGVPPDISINPNPAHSEIQIHTTRTLADCKVEVINSNGVTAITQTTSFSVLHPLKLNLGNLSEGLYFLRITNASTETSIPFVHF